MKIGDYVEVDIGLGLAAIGIIVTEHAVNRGGLYNSVDVMREALSRKQNTSTYKIRFLDESTHTAFPEECRKLTGKEIFQAKLSGDWQKAGLTDRIFDGK
jgi:hypothetical protein